MIFIKKTLTLLVQVNFSIFYNWKCKTCPCL